ncbi:MAG TPA: tyrosine-protein phosphatase [Phycisphaerales bacterium]|nr:tyrosine-protein phosphatase [Phycisphaerales bacterium]
MTIKPHLCSLLIVSTLGLAPACTRERPNGSPPAAAASAPASAAVPPVPSAGARPAPTGSAVTAPAPATPAAPPLAAEQPRAPGEAVAIASLPGLRDVGGVTTRDGAVVRRGLLYRSGQLHRIPRADVEKLATLGLVRDYDLRTEQERTARPDDLPAGVELVALDVLADGDEAATRKLSEIVRDPKRVSTHAGGNTGEATALMERTYRELVTLPSARDAYGRLFRQITEQGGTPALFHCSSGKDRGGWAAAAMLTLLGVPEEEVMRDYLRSNDTALPAYSKMAEGFVAAGGEAGVFPAVMGVQRQYLRASMDEVKQRYGSIEGYFAEGLGIDAAGQRALREKFLQR